MKSLLPFLVLQLLSLLLAQMAIQYAYYTTSGSCSGTPYTLQYYIQDTCFPAQNNGSMMYSCTEGDTQPVTNSYSDPNCQILTSSNTFGTRIFLLFLLLLLNLFHSILF